MILKAAVALGLVSLLVLLAWAVLDAQDHRSDRQARHRGYPVPNDDTGNDPAVEDSPQTGKDKVFVSGDRVFEEDDEEQPDEEPRAPSFSDISSEPDYNLDTDPKDGLQTVPDIGEKRAARIEEALGIGTADQLEMYARDGELADVDGFGEKRVESILDYFDSSQNE